MCEDGFKLARAMRDAQALGDKLFPDGRDHSVLLHSGRGAIEASVVWADANYQLKEGGRGREAATPLGAVENLISWLEDRLAEARDDDAA